MDDLGNATVRPLPCLNARWGGSMHTSSRCGSALCRPPSLPFCTSTAARASIVRARGHACQHPRLINAGSMQEQLKGGGPSILGCASGGPAALLTCGTDYREPINNSRWTCAALSRDGEYICAGASGKEQHVIRVWEAAGASLAVVLEGPPVGLRSVTWLPDPSRCAHLQPCSILSCSAPRPTACRHRERMPELLQVAPGEYHDDGFCLHLGVHHLAKLGRLRTRLHKLAMQCRVRRKRDGV